MSPPPNQDAADTSGVSATQNTYACDARRSTDLFRVVFGNRRGPIGAHPKVSQEPAPIAGQTDTAATASPPGRHRSSPSPSLTRWVSRPPAGTSTPPGLGAPRHRRQRPLRYGQRTEDDALRVLRQCIAALGREPTMAAYDDWLTRAAIAAASNDDRDLLNPATLSSHAIARMVGGWRKALAAAVRPPTSP